MVSVWRDDQNSLKASIKSGATRIDSKGVRGNPRIGCGFKALRQPPLLSLSCLRANGKRHRSQEQQPGTGPAFQMPGPLSGLRKGQIAVIRGGKKIKRRSSLIPRLGYLWPFGRNGLFCRGKYKKPSEPFIFRLQQSSWRPCVRQSCPFAFRRPASEKT